MMLAFGVRLLKGRVRFETEEAAELVQAAAQVVRLLNTLRITTPATVEIDI